MDERSRIADEQALVERIGEPMELVRSKIQNRLNAAMREFIARAPLAFVATVDADGHVDLSPKGDPAGFVEVDGQGNLLIPERPGNQLAFGFRNILRNGEIGLIFVLPNQRETLRVKGRASLHADPDVLARMQVNGKPAILYTYIEIVECYFHCGKALIRSGLWQPETWDAGKSSIAARGLFADGALGDAEQTEARLELAYTHTLY